MTVTNIAMMRPCFAGYPFQGKKVLNCHIACIVCVHTILKI